MLTPKIEYSAAEKALINYFGFTDVCQSVQPMQLYRMMVEKAFMDDDRSLFAEGLRRCLKVESTCYRLTPAWDKQITECWNDLWL